MQSEATRCSGRVTAQRWSMIENSVWRSLAAELHVMRQEVIMKSNKELIGKYKAKLQEYVNKLDLIRNAIEEAQMIDNTPQEACDVKNELLALFE